VEEVHSLMNSPVYAIATVYVHQITTIIIIFFCFETVLLMLASTVF